MHSYQTALANDELLIDTSSQELVLTFVFSDSGNHTLNKYFANMARNLHEVLGIQMCPPQCAVSIWPVICASPRSTPTRPPPPPVPSHPFTADLYTMNHKLGQDNDNGVLSVDVKYDLFYEKCQIGYSLHIGLKQDQTVVVFNRICMHD